MRQPERCSTPTGMSHVRASRPSPLPDRFVLRSLLVTPNFTGADGISRLSRELAGFLPEPSTVLALHDAAATTGMPPLIGASGRRSQFLARALALSPRLGSETVVVCTHAHLAPAVRAAAAWRRARIVIVLCGIEAWV